MPSTPLKNLLYRAALPIRAPRPRGQMRLSTEGRPLCTMKRYERLLARHHVLGSALILRDGAAHAAVYASTVRDPIHRCEAGSFFRVASITKVATAMVILRLCEQGAFRLEDPASELLPGQNNTLRGITLLHLLTHTSGLRDTAAVDEAIERGDSWEVPLRSEGIRTTEPGAVFSYCNFGFGLLGCVIEQATGLSCQEAYDRLLFRPLGMCAAIDPKTLPAERIVPISRVLPYRRGRDVIITPLGQKPHAPADPLRHFGYSAGSMYADAASVSAMLNALRQEGGGLLRPESVRRMTAAHAHYGKADPRLSYGLGLLIIEDASLSKGRILGHQGYAYGCADGAFWEESSGRQAVFLNGGCSEARTGRLGNANHDILRWALREEMTAWK